MGELLFGAAVAAIWLLLKAVGVIAVSWGWALVVALLFLVCIPSAISFAIDLELYID